MGEDEVRGTHGQDVRALHLELELHVGVAATVNEE